MFTDIVMPEMGGRQLAEAATRKRPKLKVLFTTGYDPAHESGEVDLNLAIVLKPYTLNQLAAEVRDVLGK